MKVRMKVDISGTRNAKPWPARGGTIELPDDEGKELCAAGMAEPVAKRDKTATATVKDKTEKRGG